jgi:cell division transport system permease protein
MTERRPDRRRAARPPQPAAANAANATRAPALRYSLHSGRGIIPRENIAGQALTTVIAIMAFLACLTIGTVSVVNETATRWTSDISREVTIQIRPFEDEAMEEAIRAAGRLVLQFEGIASVTALDSDASARLLEPWLGSGLDLDELPVPRLLTVSLAQGARPDFEAIKAALESQVPGAFLDDHRAWSGRLSAMAWTTVAVGIGVLALVLTATVLTVIFATRGAMAGNRAIVEVLHFVGADRRFIAREFQRHFLGLASRGAIAGGGAAALLFVSLAIWSDYYRSTPQADQLAALFGSFVIDWRGYGGIAAVIAAVAILAAGTSRVTVLRHIGALETYGRRPLDR